MMALEVKAQGKPVKQLDNQAYISLYSTTTDRLDNNRMIKMEEVSVNLIVIVLLRGR